MSIEDGHEGVPGLSQLDPMSVSISQPLNFLMMPMIGRIIHL